METVLTIIIFGLWNEILLIVVAFLIIAFPFFTNIRSCPFFSDGVASVIRLSYKISVCVQ